MRWISLFMLLCGLVNGADYGCLVGGSSSSVNNAGWYNSDLVAKADTFAANGASVDGDNGGAVTSGAGAKILITDTNQFGNTAVGMFIRVDFDGVHVDGRFEITAVTADDTVLIDEDYLGDGNINSWNVGGAVAATYNAVVYDLEDVLDNATQGDATNHNVNIYIYLASAQEITEEIKVDSNGGTGAFWKRLIGTDSSYAELADGLYSAYIDSDDNAAGHIFNITVENIELRYISAKNPAGSAGTPGNTEHCFMSSTQSCVFYACHAERGYYNYNVTGTGVKLINSSSLDCRIRAVSSGSNGMAVYGGHYEWGSAFADGIVISIGGIGTSLNNVVVEGGTYGASIGSSYGHTIVNCEFISQSVAGILISAANASPLIVNCIFDLDDTANDFAIQRTSGRYWEDYNISDADDATQSGFVSSFSSSTHNLTFTNTDPLTNITGNNFKPNRGETVADAYVIDGGMPLWFHSSTASPYPGLGAFISYDLPEIANVDSGDTVFGTTGTASGTGGGQPVMGGSVVR